MSSVIKRLVAEVLDSSADPVDPGLVPTVLAAACQEVLGVDGAGLSLIGDLRVPLAASNPEVRRAEQLQTTLGEGPCLSAVATGEGLAANPVQMMQGWPLFHHELTRQTSFRSVVSLPLVTPVRQPFGALDLYFTGAEPDRGLLEDPVRRDVVRVIATFLTGAPLATLLSGDAASLALPGGAGGVVADRMNVWAAVGMLMGATGISQPEALARLRGHAFSHTLSLEEIAHQLTTHQLPVQELVS